jgi:hypothetical protein
VLVIGIAFTWRRIAALLLLLSAFTTLAVFAPSRVSIRASIGAVSRQNREVNGALESAAAFLNVSASTIEPTKIADVRGSLWEWTGVGAELFYVRSGVAVGDRCRVGVGTNSGRLDHPFYRYSMSPHLVLARVSTKSDSFAFIDCYGGPGGGSVGPTHAPRQPAKARRGFDRDLVWSRREIIYVEGSQEPIVTPGMSLEEFCKQNSVGEYLVVVASLR